MATLLPLGDHNNVRALIWRTCTHNAPVRIRRWRNRKGALINSQGFVLLLLIFVENDSIDHHVVSRANIVNPNWSADLHSRPYDIFVEHLTTSRHVTNGLTKMVCPRPAGFLEDDYVPRSVLRDRSAALGRSSCCSRF